MRYGLRYLVQVRYAAAVIALAVLDHKPEEAPDE